jgi:cytochrome c peroxidase
MNIKYTFGFIALLLLILIVARVRMSDKELDYTALQVRVEVGEGATVPPELAAEMQKWPEIAQASQAEVELGRLLFFDPLLSSNQQVSCATCHLPDFGFSTGQTESLGVSALPLRRHAPSLWNVGFRQHLTWDGRVNTLQDQMLQGPLFNPDEMAATPDSLISQLKGNETYTELFKDVYGEVTLQHLADAIAAFQKRLISRNSPFDRYAAGEFYALTGAQRRGFEIFRSSETNCIRCHKLPTFTTDEFKVAGVGDGAAPFDGGRGEITGQEDEMGAFAVPTLRNIALSAPYMHNGIETSLNGVISFYLNGGGDNLNVPEERLEPELHRFNLSTRALKDLELFLLALTDESHLPDIPAQLPSGLQAVSRTPNPMREQIKAASALPPGSPRTHHVKEGTKIQAAIDIAQAGDTIIIAAGTYHEALEIDVAEITIKGSDVQLMGRRFTPTGITIRNHNVTLIGLEISDFKEYTIDIQEAHSIHLEEVTLNGLRVSVTLGEP